MRLMPKFSLLVIVVVLISVLSSLSVRAADQYIIFSLNPQLPTLSTSQVKMIYRGKMTQIDGIPFELLDLPASSQERNQFYQLLLNKTPSQMAAIWAKQTFSGRTKQPFQLSEQSIKEVMEWLAITPSGIAYFPANEVPSDVYVLYQFTTEEE
ncbi:hypothetical protein [Vibrio vulnificus]|uniref:hypothetical protein n=1 Tax=Vibrio vulnificus TaxID=672 RepID=UPI00159332E5|nr:hypothetical protein [Vibrio vulnificus]EJE8558906.1 hypothetical protein [Vibrio vulnificus]NVD22454.1 hypothetical protein [Vibrio vulnificus]